MRLKDAFVSSESFNRIGSFTIGNKVCQSFLYVSTAPNSTKNR